MQFGASNVPRPVVSRLPADDLETLQAQLAPVIDVLDRERAAHVDRTESVLRRALPAAALGGLAFGWAILGNIVLGLFLAALLPAFAFLFLFAKVKEGPRATTRTEIVDVLARHSTGFRVDPARAISPDGFGNLGFFTRPRKVTVDLCLTGERDGRKASVSRIGLMFGTDARHTEKQGEGLTFVMVELDLPETTQSDRATVVIPDDAPKVARNAGTPLQGAKPVPTGDAGFDARYTVFGDATQITPALRAGFARLEAQARCGPTALTEVPAGTGLRPWLAILPGKLVVLTPLKMFDGAFEPPPYWDKLDPDQLIPAFASDLAILDGYLDAALSLPIGDIT